MSPREVQEGQREERRVTEWGRRAVCIVIEACM